MTNLPPDESPGETPIFSIYGKERESGREHARSASPTAPDAYGASLQGGGTRRARAQRGVDDVVQALSADPELGARFVHWHDAPPRPGRSVPLPEGLDPRLRAVLEARGLTELYEHQARAIEHALAGRDVLIATPTASGKTLCYTVPIVQALLTSNGAARALCLYPTKALSQDQSAGLSSLFEAVGEPWHAATYDGDTPPTVRRTLRDRGHVVLTNPWMLHAGILPNHAKWSELFRSLELVVVDEVHTLSGVFGSHVANVLRRLVRICAHYGASPRFVLSSATIPAAAEHVRTLIGRDAEVVLEDASPSGRRVFGVYDPPMLDPVAGLRANALEEARRIARHVCGPGHQTIVFANRRTAVEVLTRYLKEAAKELGLAPDEIRGYRGGYLPNLRREIEVGLRDGSVKVVVATNALELGIDVGRLDVCVLVGYPGSSASFWQRAGRVGRRGGSSLVVLIARSDPVDQYLAQHPKRLFEAPRERLGLDPDNLVILSEQVKCAAFELPFRRDVPDPGYHGTPHLEDVLDYLAEESSLLLERGGTWYWMADAYPAENVSLVGNEPDNVEILDAQTKKAIGEIDREGSITTVYEGAIYHVEGETWIVERFDYANRKAWVRRIESDYFTEPATDTEVRIVRLETKLARTRAEAPVADPVEPPERPEGARAALPQDDDEDDDDYALFTGEVHVKTLATDFKKVRYYTRENLGVDDIHLPPEELDTQAVVLTLANRTATELGLVGGDRGSAWRGAGQLLRRVAPLFLRCQASDLGLSTHVRSPHFRRPAITVWERVQGGVGLSELFGRAHREILAAAFEIVDRCACAHGCPACVGTVAEVGPLGKALGARILAHLARGPAPRPVPIPAPDAAGLDEPGTLGAS